MYLGGDAIVEAPHTGALVRIGSLSRSAAALGFLGAVRPYTRRGVRLEADRGTRFGVRHRPGGERALRLARVRAPARTDAPGPSEPRSCGP